MKYSNKTRKDSLDDESSFGTNQKVKNFKKIRDIVRDNKLYNTNSPSRIRHNRSKSRKTRKRPIVKYKGVCKYLNLDINDEANEGTMWNNTIPKNINKRGTYISNISMKPARSSKKFKLRKMNCSGKVLLYFCFLLSHYWFVHSCYNQKWFRIPDKINLQV